MPIILLAKALPEEIADVSESYQNQVADIGSEKIIIGWFVHHWLWEDTARVSTRVAVAWMANGAELGMLLGLPTGLFG